MFRSSHVWVMLAVLAAMCNFATMGFAVAHQDFTLAALAALGGGCFLIVFFYKAARTDWVDYS
jgi:hypothetical protein